MTQKFQSGDLVQIADDLGEFMAHFPAGERAVVVGSYRDQFGGGGRESGQYTLDLESQGRTSWYHEAQITLIERGGPDIAEEWARVRNAVAAERGDLDWIFDNGPEVLRGAHGPTVEALARGLNAGDLSPHGEGYEYVGNALAVLGHAAPFLEAGDKAGWLAYCAEHEEADG